MTAPTVTAMREYLAAAITADMPADTVRVESYFPLRPNPPSIIVQGPSADYNEDTMTDHYVFPILVIVSAAADRAAQLLLDEYLAPAGTKSVRAAVENGPTISGVQYAVVTALHDYGTIEIANVQYLGAIIDAHVVANRY